MWPLEEQYIIVAPIHMSERTTVRWGSIILPGVEMGEWSIVGANSMVKDNVPPETIVAGNPAKKIGENKQEVVCEQEKKQKGSTRSQKKNTHQKWT